VKQPDPDGAELRQIWTLNLKRRARAFFSLRREAEAALPLLWSIPEVIVASIVHNPCCDVIA